MSERIIQIDIKRDGTVNIEAIGFKGEECEQATLPFEEKLGKIATKNYKQEYYEQNVKHKSHLTIRGE